MPETTDFNWSPRIRPEKIRRLYESDARGLLDEELLGEVGFGLYSRCQDILEVSQAVRGRVKCRRCGAFIERRSIGQPEEKHEILSCANCSWQVAWEAYLKSYQGQRLYAGLADSIFESFLKEWGAANSSQAKLIAIDNLIHAFHLYQNAPGRPVGVNVVHGKVREVIDLIDGLAYGAGSTPGLEESRDRWRGGFGDSLCYPSESILLSGKAGIPEFGEKEKGVEYTPRPGAYAVIFDGRRRVAVVRAGRGYFLPGGGALAGEIPEDTLRREIREECGRETLLRKKIGEAVSYLYAPGEEKHYRIHGCFFTAAFGKRIGEPVEKDHTLCWLMLEEALESLSPAQAWAVSIAA
jgi:8-oxo-dGTP diphosphatase